MLAASDPLPGSVTATAVSGGADVLISASAPRTAERLADLGFQPRVVDISEFEKLEGCVTCLSVLVHAPHPAT
jgi:dimethylargininase